MMYGMKIGERVATTLASLVSGLVAAQVVKVVWRLVVRSKPPTDAKNMDLPTVQVAAFAATVAAVTAVAQTLAQRAALSRFVEAQPGDDVRLDR